MGILFQGYWHEFYTDLYVRSFYQLALYYQWLPQMADPALRRTVGSCYAGGVRVIGEMAVSVFHVQKENIPARLITVLWREELSSGFLLIQPWRLLYLLPKAAAAKTTR